MSFAVPGNRPLLVAAASEMATGLWLMVAPSLFIGLMLGARITGATIVTSRITGIALLALGLACWPSQRRSEDVTPSLPAMLIYDALAALYLGYLGAGGQWRGALLWPAVGLHAVLTLLLARAWLKARKPADRRDINPPLPA